MAHNIDIELQISKIMVENKYKTPLSNNDMAIWMVDIPKAAKEIAAALQPIEAIEDEDELWSDLIIQYRAASMKGTVMQQLKQQFTIKRKQ